MAPIDLLGLDAAPATDEPEAVSRARAFAEGGPSPGSLPGPVADALIDLLLRRGQGDRLAELGAQRGDKELAKKARRAIHVLRTRGVAVEVPRAAVASVRPVEADEVPPSILVLEGDGASAIVFYVETVGRDSGVQVCEAHLDEERGLTTFESYEMSRRGWRSAMADLEGDPRLAGARIPSAFARWLVEEGYQRTMAAARPVPRAFLEVRHTLAPATAPARHPLLDLIGDDLVAAAGPPERVLALPEVAHWMPDEAWLEHAEAKLQEITESPLNVDERMKRQRVREALNQLAAEALAAGWRRRLERRFLDVGYAILQVAERKRQPRLGDAALCVAASRSMADGAPLDDNPIAYTLFARLMRAPDPEASPAPSPRSPGGLILP